MIKYEEIPIKYIFALGLMRVNNVCAMCKKKINLERYNIQLCSKCRKDVSSKINCGQKNEKR